MKISRILSRMGGAILILALGMGNAGAATVFYDRNLYNAAVQAAFGTVTVGEDHFDENVSGSDAITFGSGVTSTNSGGNRWPQDNRIVDGRYQNAVDIDGTDASQRIDWLFPNDIVAFGFDCISCDSADGLTLYSQVDGPFTTKFAIHQNEENERTGFFGVVGTVAFSALEFGSEGGPLLEAFEIGNLTFASQASVSSVPLPAAAPLYGASLGLLGLLGWWRRRDSDKEG